jgi:SAM-dependent methyltransferase
VNPPMTQNGAGRMGVREKAIFSRHLARVPAHRALIRALENRLFDRETPQHPILDLGCGDGYFAAVAFPKGIDIGVDAAESAVAESRGNGPYRHLVVASGTALPCPDGRFATVVSNCAIEHIADSGMLVAEVARVLAPGGKFIFSVMNDRFTGMLFIVRALLRIRMPGVAGAYGRWWNRKAAHYRLDSPDDWKSLLAKNGFEVESHTYYLSQDATRVFELAHYVFALPALLCRKLTGRWHWRNVEARRGLAYRWLYSYAAEPWPGVGSASFFVARKTVGSGAKTTRRTAGD